MTQTNLDLALTLLPIELWNTIYMVLVAAALAGLIGLPLGIVLVITDKGHLKENRLLHETLGWTVNIGRSFPFAILMIALIPFTRFLIGSSLGTTAAIVPLTIAAIPFFARLAETCFCEVDKALIEAALVMGASSKQIIYKVLLPEALPSLILAMTTTLINLIGYSTMAGTMGGGGLGKVAIQYGYQRFNTFLIIATVIILIVLVQLIQWGGNYLAKQILQKRGRSLSR